jgi:hypothetical protein
MEISRYPAGVFTDGAHIIRLEKLPTANRELRPALVVDPDAPVKRRGRPRLRAAMVNIRTDVLEYEYAHNHISDTAYLAGRVYQRTLEEGYLASVSAAGTTQERIDNNMEPEEHMREVLDKITRMQRMLERTRPLVGLVGERVLRRVLLERAGFGQLAAMGDGGPMNRGARRAAAARHAVRFRDALEVLAGHWSEWNDDNAD